MKRDASSFLGQANPYKTSRLIVSFRKAVQFEETLIDILAESDSSGRQPLQPNETIRQALG